MARATRRKYTYRPAPKKGRETLRQRETFSSFPSSPRSAPRLQAGPAAPPTPPPAAPDSGYWAEQQLNQQRRGETMTRYGNPRAGAGAGFAQRYGSQGEQVARRYGYESGYDNNPYSMAKQMERAYQQNREGTLNRGAAQGGLYSGSLQGQLGEVDRGYAQQDHETRGAYQGELGRIQETASEALAALDRGDLDAYMSWLERAQAMAPAELAGPEAAAAPAQRYHEGPAANFDGLDLDPYEKERRRRRRR